MPELPTGVQVVDEIEQVPIPRINLAAYNPRSASQIFIQTLTKSIEKYGFVEPVVVNRRSEGFAEEESLPTLVGGHQRVKAALVLGLEKVPVVWVDLGPVAERELNLALNKIEADWEGSMLAETLRWIDEHGGSYVDAGFTDQAEVDRIILSAEVDVPLDFPSITDQPNLPDSIHTEFECPSCGYEWSGVPKPAKQGGSGGD